MPRHILALHCASLGFKDPRKEDMYQVHQQKLWKASDCKILLVHLICSTLHLSLNASILTGSRLSIMTARLVTPYAAVVLLHIASVQFDFYYRHRTTFLVGFEAAYAIISGLNLPSRNAAWIVADTDGFRALLKPVLFGTGSMLCCYYAFMLQKSWRTFCWVVPLDSLLLGLYLSPSVCQTLHQTAFGRQAMEELFSGLDMAAGSVIPSYSPRSWQYSCHAILLTQVVLCVCLLLYVRYRMEVGSRAAFAKSLGFSLQHHPLWEQPWIIRVGIQAFVGMTVLNIAWTAVNFALQNFRMPDYTSH